MSISLTRIVSPSSELSSGFLDPSGFFRRNKSLMCNGRVKRDKKQRQNLASFSMGGSSLKRGEKLYALSSAVAHPAEDVMMFLEGARLTCLTLPSQTLSPDSPLIFSPSET